MTRPAYAQKRDGNEAAIIELFRRCGWFVKQMDGNDGFDLLACRDSITLIIEVKQLGEHLTDNEKRVKAGIEQAGGEYHVIYSPEQAAQIM